MKTVGELMTRELVTLKETQNLAIADELLRLNRIRHLPVVRGGKLVGLITHRDLLKATGLKCPDPARQPLWAADIMNREVRTVRPDTPLREAVAVMLDNKFGCLPVVGEEDALLGIVTEADLVRYAQQLIADLDRLSEAAEYE
ncbi:CBS domain-containing protein [Hyalangium rubrum]|uniref:CBS domain-containing protein n=1 Tax=Hyalangium rubrum TaxID=3103134 RepID=A0ABU5H4Q9_9BACT|nr:CBS domain-containing protein [Hyalangium sp. s54d21]MDY7228226.1 CBS domain-containing protein [Hyalangium sp. s54d21]